MEIIAKSFAMILTTAICLAAVAGNLAKSANTTIPLIINKQYGYASIPIIIQGKKLLIGFDLGSSGPELTLNQETIKSKNIKVKYTGKTSFIESTQGVKYYFPKFILSSLQLGNFVVHNIHGDERTAKSFGGVGGPRNGIIGLPLISKFNIIIDFSGKKLVLIKGNGYPTQYNIHSWKKIPFFIRYGNIFTHIKIANKKLAMIWDTDATTTFVKPTIKIPGMTNRCPKWFLFRMATTAKICKAITTTFTSDKQTFGPLVIGTYPSPGLPADGIIGDNFFAKHIVYINFNRKIIAIKKI